MRLLKVKNIFNQRQTKEVTEVQNKQQKPGNMKVQYIYMAQ